VIDGYWPEKLGVEVYPIGLSGWFLMNAIEFRYKNNLLFDKIKFSPFYYCNHYVKELLMIPLMHRMVNYICRPHYE
jgi:hypothetical protein